jgi:hypothetical protein
VQELVELRNYTLVAGAAEAFAEHFERSFLAAHAAFGMPIVGRFTVPGDDARFVWVRRFPDPSGRADALRAFYGGPVWKELGPRANELMVDHTDVHLLTPDPSSPAFPGAAGGPRPSTVVAAVYDLPAGTAAIPPGAVAAMTDAVGDVAPSSVVELGRLVTAHVPNAFPALPVHEDRTVAVWLLSGSTPGDAAVALAEAVAPAVTATPPQLLRLTPTLASPLH